MPCRADAAELGSVTSKQKPVTAPGAAGAPAASTLLTPPFWPTVSAGAAEAVAVPTTQVGVPVKAVASQVAVVRTTRYTNAVLSDAASVPVKTAPFNATVPAIDVALVRMSTGR